jgi:hypothetical protein
VVPAKEEICEELDKPTLLFGCSVDVLFFMMFKGLDRTPSSFFYKQRGFI